MTTNSLFIEDELLAVLKDCCYDALAEDGNLPDGVALVPSDIWIRSKVDTDVFSKTKVVVTYSEEDSGPIMGEYEEGFKGLGGTLLRGGGVRQLNSLAQVTVYSQIRKNAYRIGERIMDEMDMCAKTRRNGMRFFTLIDRHSALDEHLDCWVAVFKIKVQLQPGGDRC